MKILCTCVCLFCYFAVNRISILHWDTHWKLVVVISSQHTGCPYIWSLLTMLIQLYNCHTSRLFVEICFMPSCISWTQWRVYSVILLALLRLVSSNYVECRPEKNIFSYFFLEFFAQRRNLGLSSSQIKELKCE
jgi:hypothetical protein